MDFELNESQRAIVEAVTALLGRHAGTERAAALGLADRHDAALYGELEAAGFLAVGTGETSTLDAVLVTEAVSRAAGVVPVGFRVIVAHALSVEVAGPLTLMREGDPGPVRFGADAQHVLIDAGSEARLAKNALQRATRVPASTFSLPIGRPSFPSGASPLGSGSGSTLRAAWRLALAAELLGCMEAALELTVGYVKDRRQFGKAIGSFQAVQHRLAQCAVAVEATRWLTYECAATGAGAESAATAAAQANAAAGLVFRETHQLTGAMGFTREHALHVHTLRIPILRLELGGLAEHHRAITRARWGHLSS